MEKKIPRKLYKFQSFKNAYSIDNIRWGRIWLSKAEGLNDPFDCAIPMCFDGLDDPETMSKFLQRYYLRNLRKQGETEQIQRLKSQHLTNGKPDQALLEVMHKMLGDFGQGMFDEFSQMGVACFTTELKNLLMWSHYADGHKGFCLEFDTDYFGKRQRESLRKVFYRNAYPVLSPLYLTRKFLLRMVEPFYTKSNHWKYEKEWRLLVRTGNKTFEYNPKALTAIYFGCLARDEDIRKITTLPAKSAPRLYQMQRSRTQFELEYVPYQLK